MKSKKIPALCLGLMLSGSLALHAQTVNLGSNKVSLKTAFEKIEKASKYKIAYNATIVDANRTVTVSKTKGDAMDLLREVLADAGYGYEVNGNYITVKPQANKQKQGNSKKRTVKGRVVDANGEPIIGASVRIKGSGQGAITDIDGNYSLDNVPDGATLEVSYVGFSSKNISTGTRSQLDVTLAEDVNVLNEVVAIGYGTTTVKSSAGSISSIKADAISTTLSSNFADALSGQVTGVQVIQPSGQPGTEDQIRVRGIGTLTAGSSPLIVVDGFPLSEGSTLSSINTASIESIEVLKDAASTAIYGSRGANGVIMVKTKAGSTAKPSVNLSATWGWQSRNDRVELVGAYDFATFLKEARNTGYVNKNPTKRSETDTNEQRKKNKASKRELIPDYIVPYLNGEQGLTDTDWFDEIMRTASVRNYDLSVSGGSDKFKYNFTGGYMKQDGIVIGTDFEKYSANVNLSFKPSKAITIGTSLFPSYSKRHTTRGDELYGSTLLSSAIITYPFFSPYNEDGSYAISEQIKANKEYDGALNENPVAWANMVDSERRRARFFGNVYAEVEIIKGLKYKLNIGGDYESMKYKYFKPSTIGQYRTAAPYPAAAENNQSDLKNYLIENTLNYSTYLDKGAKHHVDFLLGQSYQREDYEKTNITASGFTDNSIRNIAGGSTYGVTASQYAWSMISYFGRVNYSLLDRYLLNVSYRRDGSSRFGKNSKWGSFPAVSGAWILSSEPFMNRVKNVIDYAKVRVSWGKSGNNQIPNFGSLAVLKKSDYIFNGELVSGSLISTSPNPDLSWEKTSTLNIGLNIVLFKYLGIDMDFYRATTNGLLLDVPVPEQSGYDTSLQNIGKLRNTGFEAKLYTAKPLQLGKVGWNSNFTLSTNKDKVLALAPGQTQIITRNNITRVGHSIGELYGYEVIGIYKTQEDLDKYPHMSGTQLGDYIIKDLDGDNKITTKDKKSWGSPSPKVILGWNNTINYMGFELTIDLYSELGKKKYNHTTNVLNCGEGFGLCSKDYFKNRWHPVDNPNGTWVTPNMGNYSNTRKQGLYSNLYYDNASFLQLRTLKLAYNLPQSLLAKVGIARAQVYFLGNNLLMLTPYKGFNVQGEDHSDVLQQGAEYFTYPMARTLSVGLNVTF